MKNVNIDGFTPIENTNFNTFINYFIEMIEKYYDGSEDLSEDKNKADIDEER